LKKDDRKEKKKSKWDQDTEDDGSKDEKVTTSRKKSEGDSDRNRGRAEWRVDIIKNDTKVGSHTLDQDFTVECGRSEAADIKLEHGSCSKNHAKITFQEGKPAIMDLSSTNGTQVNAQEVTAGQWVTLKEGDILKFGCSTREYRVACQYQ